LLERHGTPAGFLKLWGSRCVTLSIHPHHCQGMPPPLNLSSRPKRTRVSCYAALTTAACAAFSKESRMKFANAAKLDRKSGVAQRRDLQFHCRAQRMRRGKSPPGSVSLLRQTALRSGRDYKVNEWRPTLAVLEAEGQSQQQQPNRFRFTRVLFNAFSKLRPRTRPFVR
jgi:hypothetical protein